MPKKRQHKRKVARRKQPRQRQSNILKATTDVTKIAVTGLVGAGLIASTGAALKNLTGT